jgi:glycosyltransferase involved in cell wall biosynthesis
VRIGYIAPPWVPTPPPAYGGTEAVVDRLARGLVDAGHEVLLAAAGNSTCPVDQVPGSRVAPSGAPATGPAHEELGFLLNAYTHMSDCDLIHDHTMIGPMMYQWHQLNAGARPIVSTFHHPIDDRFIPLYREQRSAAIAISANQAAKASMADIRVDTIIHHGVDVDDIPEGSGEGGYASFLGRMHPDKGVREAIMVARLAGVPLRIGAKVREPLEWQYFEAEIKPLLSSTIEYLGELNADEKYALLGGSFAMLKPDNWDEPFGLVVIESLACGTPVVSTPRGATLELVENGVTGRLEWGTGRMAAALASVKDLDRTLCRKTAKVQFDTPCMVTKHIRFYEGLLGDAKVE